MRDHETQPAKLSALVRFYPAFIVMGVAFFAISLWTFEGWHKITAALWVDRCCSGRSSTAATAIQPRVDRPHGDPAVRGRIHRTAAASG